MTATTTPQPARERLRFLDVVRGWALILIQPHGSLVAGRLETGETVRAEDLVIRECHRVEGISDPDDMAIAFAVEGTGGPGELVGSPIVRSARHLT